MDKAGSLQNHLKALGKWSVNELFVQ